MTQTVCDAGPLTHLWQIDQWRAFSVFSAIHIAAPVAAEVRRHVQLEYQFSIGFGARWCAVRTLQMLHAYWLTRILDNLALPMYALGFSVLGISRVVVTLLSS